MNEQIAGHLLNIERKLWTNDAVFYRDNLTEDCLLVFPETGVISRNVAVEAIRKENREGRRWAEVYFDELVAGVSRMIIRGAAFFSRLN